MPCGVLGSLSPCPRESGGQGRGGQLAGGGVGGEAGVTFRALPSCLPSTPLLEGEMSPQGNYCCPSPISHSTLSVQDVCISTRFPHSVINALRL